MQLRGNQFSKKGQANQANKNLNYFKLFHEANHYEKIKFLQGMIFKRGKL